MKKNDFEEKDLFGVCPFYTTQRLVLGKWILPILHELSGGAKRFGQLQKSFGITRTTLSQQLKLLEHEGFICRKVFPEVPPRVEYSLTEIGESFRPVLDSIETWGSNYIQYLKTRDEKMLRDC